MISSTTPLRLRNCRLFHHGNLELKKDFSLYFISETEWFQVRLEAVTIDLSVIKSLLQNYKQDNHPISIIIRY